MVFVGPEQMRKSTHGDSSESLLRIMPQPRGEDNRGLVLKHAANELVFAVVGHVGSGTSEIAAALKESLEDRTLPGGLFAVKTLKASDVIIEWARARGETIPDKGAQRLAHTTKLQDLGDQMRSAKTVNGEADYSAVAGRLILKIRGAGGATRSPSRRSGCDPA